MRTVAMWTAGIIFGIAVLSGAGDAISAARQGGSALGTTAAAILGGMREATSSYAAQRPAKEAAARRSAPRAVPAPKPQPQAAPGPTPAPAPRADAAPDPLTGHDKRIRREASENAQKLRDRILRGVTWTPAGDPR